MDKELYPFFKNLNLELHKIKVKEFITHLAGGKKFYIGKNMIKAHKGIKITDKLFDQFINHFVHSLKEMKIKIDVLRDFLKIIQDLRETVVQK